MSNCCRRRLIWRFSWLSRREDGAAGTSVSTNCQDHNTQVPRPQAGSPAIRCGKTHTSRKFPASRHRSRREARVQVRNSTRDKSIDSGSFDRNDWQEPDQRSDGAIVLINGENHYGMRFVLSNPRATKSSFLAGFVLALVFGGERASPSHSRRLLTPPTRTIRSAIAARAAGMSPAAAAAVRRLAGVPRNLSQALSLRASGAPAPASAMLPVKTRDCRAQHHRVRAAGPPHSHSPRVFSPQRPVISSPHHNPAAIIHGGRRGSTVLRDRAARPDLGHQLVSQS